MDKARIVVTQAEALLSRVRTNLANQQFAADDILMKEYNELARAAFDLFPDDPVLGHLETLPDAMQRAYGTPIGLLAAGLRVPPSHLATTRLESHGSRLVNRLQFLVGQPPVLDDATRPAAEVLRSDLGAEIQGIVAALDDLRRRQPDLPPIDARTFDFVGDQPLRGVLAADFAEAQRAFGVVAFKATALLAGGLVEGMLLDALQNPKIVAHGPYQKAVAKLPVLGTGINWDRVSLNQLISAAVDVGLLDATTARLAEGARDFRDTVHPKAELRQGIRAQREEAELLLALVKIVYRQLASRL